MAAYRFRPTVSLENVVAHLARVRAQSRKDLEKINDNKPKPKKKNGEKPIAGFNFNDISYLDQMIRQMAGKGGDDEQKARGYVSQVLNTQGSISQGIFDKVQGEIDRLEPREKYVLTHRMFQLFRDSLGSDKRAIRFYQDVDRFDYFIQALPAGSKLVHLPGQTSLDPHKEFYGVAYPEYKEDSHRDVLVFEDHSDRVTCSLIRAKYSPDGKIKSRKEVRLRHFQKVGGRDNHSFDEDGETRPYRRVDENLGPNPTVSLPQIRVDVDNVLVHAAKQVEYKIALRETNRLSRVYQIVVEQDQH